MSNDGDNYLSIPNNQLSDGLTEDERRKVACQPTLSQFQRDKLEKDAKKNWDLFYKRNGDRFFKNRYWTRREFYELFDQTDEKLKYLLEIGCGCGNFALPLIEDDDQRDDEKGEHPEEAGCSVTDRTRSVVPNDMIIYCCDISEKAIELLRSNPIYKRNSPTRINAFVADITDSESIATIMSNNLAHNQMDVVSLVFVLSALDPSKMSEAVGNVNKLMRPGGLVLFRDYAIYDKAMLRFSEKSKICEQFYVRQDGTRAYFFTKEQLIELFGQCHFDCQSIDYLRSETVNNATKDKYSRIFLQAKFKKRATMTTSLLSSLD